MISKSVFHKHKIIFCINTLFNVGLLTELGCGLTAAAGASSLVTNSSLTGYNYLRQAVYAWPLKLDDGTQMYAGLPPRSRMVLSGRLPETAFDLEWNSPERMAWMPEEWPLENSYGRIRNGALEITFQKQRIQVGVPRLQGDLTTSFVHPMLSPLVFSGRIEGRPGRFSTELFSRVNGRVYHENGWAVMEIVKELNEAGEGVTSRETLRLHPDYPLFDYALSFSNRTDETLSFVLSHASGAAQIFYTGEFLEGRKVFHCDRKKMRSGVLDDSTAWISVQARFLNPSAWAVVQDDNGYCLGVSTRGRYGSLFGAETKWIFPENRMVLDLPCEKTDQENGRPIVLYPGREAETGIRLYLLPPAAERPLEIGAAFLNQLAGQPVEFASPLAVYRKDKPVIYASVDSLEDMHRYPNLWHIRDGQLSTVPEGIQFHARAGLAEASLAVRFPARHSLVAKVSFSQLSPETTAELLWVDPDLQPTCLATWDRPGSEFITLPDAREQLTGQLILRVSGPEGAEAILSGFRAGAKRPPAPEPVFPLNNATHIAAGVSFRWQPVPNVLQYDLEISTSSDFSDPIRHTIEYTAKEALFGRPDRGAPGDAGFFPEERLAPGVWYWRTRAVATYAAGEWSSTRSFTVRESSSTSKSRFKLSPSNLLFCSSFNVGRSGEVLDQASRAAGTKLRDQVVNRLILETVRSARGENWEEFFNSVAKADGRFMIQPGHSGLDLALFETALQKCPNIIGFCQGELFWGFWDFPDRREVARRILELSAEYGAWFLWGDGQEGAFNWLRLQEDPAWRDTLHQYGDHLIPTWKMNLLTGQFTTQGTVLGMQMDGLVPYTGVWPESFYWSEIGFGARIGESLGRQKGRTADMPPPFWIQNYLLGVAQGSVAFVNHDPSLLWSPDGTPTETWTKHFQPFFEFMKETARPPDLDALRAQVRMVQVPSVSDLEYHEDYGPFAALYRSLYSVQPGREVIELIPDRPDYKPIALIRKETPGSVPLSQLTDAGTVQKFFPAEPVQAVSGAFPAWTIQNEKILLVMNPSENTPGKAGYSVRFGKDAGLHLHGKLDVHAYLIASQTDQGVELLMNGRIDVGQSSMVLACKSPFTVRTADGENYYGGPQKEVRLMGNPQTFPLRITWKLGSTL